MSEYIAPIEWFRNQSAFLDHSYSHVVDKYKDQANGVMSKAADGKIAMTLVTRHPDLMFIGEKQPGISELQELHYVPNENYFIARSDKSEIRCEPLFQDNNQEI